MTRLLSLAALVLALAACDSGDTAPEEIPDEQVPMFVPLEANNTWSYARSLPASDAGADPFTVSMQRESRDGRDVFTLDSDFSAYDDAFYEYVEDGLRRVELSSSGSVSRDYTFLFDLDRTSYTHVGAPSRSDWTFRTLVRSTDSTITTPAGSFDTVVLQTIWTDENGSVQTRDEEYYALGIGVVRLKRQILTYQINQWDLTSYRVGSSPVQP